METDLHAICLTNMGFSTAYGDRPSCDMFNTGVALLEETYHHHHHERIYSAPVTVWP